MGSVKRQGAVKIGMEKSDEKGEQKPHIQFLCTAPLYSTKHTVVLIGSAHYTVHNHTSQAFPPFSICQLISTCQILLMKERMWRKGGCKETGGGEKRMEKVTRRESKKNATYSSYVQLVWKVF